MQQSLSGKGSDFFLKRIKEEMNKWWKKGILQMQTPPEWGVEPVPVKNRILGFWDYLILWGDLGIGLLVLLAGSFLVPGLGFNDAIQVIILGSLIGAGLLSVVGLMGSKVSVPTMVLLRPVLGLRGSILPSVINVIQLIGWTIFEFVIMGFAADAIFKNLFGFSNLYLWTALFAVVVIIMGLGGPLGVVREWLKKIAVWIVLVTSIWLTWHLLSSYDLSRILTQTGDGSIPFWVAVDLVISMPVSWLPLVADYNRFAKKPAPAFWGTFAGYALSNIWFYLLGVIILMAASFSQEPKEFVQAVVMTAGWIAFLVLLLDETDNAWADLYSSTVSIQNVLPKINQRWLIIGLGICSFIAAVLIDITRYESFLLLTGSLLIPLFGAAVADYFIINRQHYYGEDLFKTQGRYWYTGGINLVGIIAWLLGIVLFQVTNPATLGGFFPAWMEMIPSWMTGLGGSIPSFLGAFIIYALLTWLVKTIHPVAFSSKME